LEKKSGRALKSLLKCLQLIKRGYGNCKFLGLVKQSEAAVWKGKTQQMRTAACLNGSSSSDFYVSSQIVFSSGFNPGSSEGEY